MRTIVYDDWFSVTSKVRRFKVDIQSFLTAAFLSGITLSDNSWLGYTLKQHQEFRDRLMKNPSWQEISGGIFENVECDMELSSGVMCWFVSGDIREKFVELWKSTEYLNSSRKTKEEISKFDGLILVQKYRRKQYSIIAGQIPNNLYSDEIEKLLAKFGLSNFGTIVGDWIVEGASKIEVMSPGVFHSIYEAETEPHENYDNGCKE